VNVSNWVMCRKRLPIMVPVERSIVSRRSMPACHQRLPPVSSREILDRLLHWTLIVERYRASRDLK
jgi:hypothetical protein